MIMFIAFLVGSGYACMAILLLGLLVNDTFLTKREIYVVVFAWPFCFIALLFFMIKYLITGTR